MQILRESYDGNEKEVNVCTYKYEKHNEPIILEGKIDLKINKVQLYEGKRESHTRCLNSYYQKMNVKVP